MDEGLIKDRLGWRAVPAGNGQPIIGAIHAMTLPTFMDVHEVHAVHRRLTIPETGQSRFSEDYGSIRTRLPELLGVSRMSPLANC